MSCGCAQPDRSSLWSPIPDYQQPTEILPGENIDCYTKRSSSVGKNDVAEKLVNRIDNTSLVSDLALKVNELLKLTPGSTKVAARWEATIDGQSISTVLPELSFNANTGQITGTIQEPSANKNYKVMVKAYDTANALIDAREFNFFPKKGSKDGTVKFVFPFSSGGRVTSPFGPRNSPARGASNNHKGVDISLPGSALGDILAAADGTVVQVGPARGFGNWVVIEHRDAQNKLVATTVYGHMNEWYVRVGQQVAAGQKIAKEGNAGIGTAAHLHFELHMGQRGNQVDPIPYINGNFAVAQNNIPGEYGIPDPNSFASVNNTDRGITTQQTDASNTADCPKDLSPLQTGDEGTPTGNTAPAVPISPDTASVQASIQQALDEDPDLNAEDKKLLMFIAKIESRFKADAKNPTSSARGVYQMLDKTAVKYYGLIGIPATEANRNNPYYATKAQISFYKKEQKKYWNEYNSSGKTTIAGKQLDPGVSARYANYSQGEFIYGLIHHDGVGNAVSGRDLQGVGYYRKKVREA